LVKNISPDPFDGSFARKIALIESRNTGVFLMGEMEKKMSPDANRKSNDAIKEIAEILAAGIIRMKKKGKLK
jgi:hypothetical protein